MTASALIPLLFSSSCAIFASMMLRSFIAVEIPVRIQDSIAQSIAPIKNALPRTLVRWVAQKNVHLTLKFLGDVSPTNLEHVAEAVGGEAALHGKFSISMGGLGAFPSMRRARVIWLGLKAPPDLEALWRGVEAAMTQLGYNQEERPFSPHLTIGRVGQNISPADLQHIRLVLEAAKIGEIGTFQVEAVHIFKSDLRPSGPVYTHMYTLPMKST
jgi:2'-5' RNA ligase